MRSRPHQFSWLPTCTTTHYAYYVTHSCLRQGSSNCSARAPERACCMHACSCAGRASCDRYWKSARPPKHTALVTRATTSALSSPPPAPGSSAGNRNRVQSRSGWGHLSGSMPTCPVPSTMLGHSHDRSKQRALASPVWSWDMPSYNVKVLHSHLRMHKQGHMHRPHAHAGTCAGVTGSEALHAAATGRVA